MTLRESLNKKYYVDWQPTHSAWTSDKDQITDDYLVNMYREYIDKLDEFLDEISNIETTITKEEFKPNIRQTGGFDRCVKEYPDTGWKEKHLQYAQAYTEMMSDFLCYSPTLEYDEMSLHEIDILKKMAMLMIKRANENIDEIN